MILLCAGPGMLARLMAADPRGPDTTWLLAGPTDESVVECEDEAQDDDWPLAAE